jgi:ABC-2 type transport system ATP-binding protein
MSLKGDTKAVIKIQNLTKIYDKLTAVNRLNLEVYKGEIFGLLGPNGAGKTTTIRMLVGLAKPTSGSATVLGYDIVKDSVTIRKFVGVVPQGNVLDRELTVEGNFIYHAKMHGMKKERYEGTVKKALSLIGLKGSADADPITLSGGMKRRATVGKALVHEPDVLFLDEPTTGLDPQAKRALWHQIQVLSKEGITIILTTHYMEEAELLCDRVGIIDNGKIIALDTPKGLKKLLKGETVLDVRFEDGIDQSTLENNELIESVDSMDDTVRIYTHRKKEVVLFLMKEFGEQISSIDFHDPTLEDVFIYLTGKELRET